jgi:hypothetical protein
LEELKKNPGQPKPRKLYIIYLALAGFVSVGGVTLFRTNFYFINYFHSNHGVSRLDRTSGASPSAPKTASPEIEAAVAAVFGRATAAVRRLSMTDEQAISRCNTGDRWEVEQLPNAIYTSRYSAVTLRNIIDAELQLPSFNSLPIHIKTRLGMEIRDLLNLNGLMDKQLGLECGALDRSDANRIRRTNLSIAAERLEFSEREVLDRLSYLLN